MATPAAADTGLAPVYRDDPRLAALIGPGGPFETEPVVLDGVPLRDFVRAPRTVVDVFRMGAAHDDELVQLVYQDERLTFSQTRDRSLRLARALRSRFGVGPGDRVAIAMRNLPEFVVAFWAAALDGAIAVPLNAWWTGAELEYALRDAGVSVLFADGKRCERLREGPVVVGVRTDAGDVALDELMAEPPLPDDEFARPGRDDPVALLYTSGTTGRPKGALLTNRGIIASLLNMAFATRRDAVLSGRRPASPPRQPAAISTGPLFHIGGVSSIVGAQLSGGRTVLMRRWDVHEWARLAVREQVTSLGGVPAVARQILEYPGLDRLGLQVGTFAIGGAAVPPDLVRLAGEVLGPEVAVLNGYGGTETTSAVVANVGAEYAAHPDSVGRPNLTAEVRVVDGGGSPLPDGETGELCFRSPQVARGYWNDEAATKASFGDGWFHSGDVGRVGPEGYVHVVDRIKDVVIRGGENVYCAEVEAVLHEHPDVARAAVVGVPEPVLGERVCAAVVPRPGAAPDLAGLREFAAGRLAAFKCPEALTVLLELPETATGKVAKNELRALITAAKTERLW
jgi:acyl-CoA synthetase (AMP-forming)/AMP-acid ligase II